MGDRFVNAPGGAGHDDEALSAKGREAVIRRILTLMEFWAITPADLEGEWSAPAGPELHLPPKYRHPVSGDTWDGRGEHPPWLRQALLCEGYTVQQLREAAQGG